MNRPPVGVDRVSVSWGVSSWQSSGWSQEGRSVHSGDTVSETYAATLDVGGAPFMLGVRKICGIPGAFAKVEFNPSRHLDPDGFSLAPVVELRPLLASAVAVATAMVDPPVSLDEVRVKRLDLAVDFDTVAPSGLLVALAGVHRSWTKRNAVYRDPARNHAQTLAVGSGAGMLRAYDKHAETGGAVPAGTLRVEVEARAGWLGRYGSIDCLGSAHLMTCEMLFRNRWEWSHLGDAVITDLASVVERVDAAGLSGQLARSFLGWLVLEAAGGKGGEGMSSATLAKYRRVQRSIGVVIDPDLFLGASNFTRRLDLDTASEVVSVA